MNNKTLSIIFGILLLIAAVIWIFQSSGNERTFREVLVDIDTSAVTEILIYPKSQKNVEVKLFKENGNWKVLLSSGGSANVSNQRMSSLFAQLLAIQPKRLAARDESKWKELQVDSSGSRVKVYQGSDLTLDLIIGRFSFQQPRSMNTFVRLYNDKDVYEVEGFLDMTFNQGANTFRDGTIINSDYKSWKQIQFNYSADTSFQLVNQGNQWMLNGKPVDSLKTINYLNRIHSLSNNNFIDDEKIIPTTNPIYSINITTAEMDFIAVKCFVDSAFTIIHSSQNPEAWFDGSSIIKSIFVGKSEFLSK